MKLFRNAEELDTHWTVKIKQNQMYRISICGGGDGGYGSSFWLPIATEQRERGSVRRNAFGSNKSSRVESSRAEPIWRKWILQWLLMVVYLLTDDFQHMFMENNISFGSLKVATEKLWISNSFNFTEIVSISKYGIKVRNVTEWMKTK